MIDFGRDVCGDLANSEWREWLVTNGIGGFGMGTVNGTLTRRYHGLLIAALQPPLGRTLLFAKGDETVLYAGVEYKLFNNRWVSGQVEPNGHHFLQRFYLDGQIPVWEYALADALLEKRIWMAQGENSTYIQYRLTRGLFPMKIYMKLFVNYRDYHGLTLAADWQTEIQSLGEMGMKVVAMEGAMPLYFFGDRAKIWAEYAGHWYKDYLLAVEEERGFSEVVEDHLYAGTAEMDLQTGGWATVIASTLPNPVRDGATALQKRQMYEAGLIQKADPSVPAQLVLAADQFIVQRATADDVQGLTVLAGYPWFSDWGRDTMIALPGLTLPTGRMADAGKILRTFAQFVSDGMLPNRFPDVGDKPEYNTADATLWYFEAVRATFVHTQDLSLVQDLYPVLAQIVEWHRRGTRYGIGVDNRDGLLRAGTTGYQLTWMDVKIGDWVVTPRIGKPIEINALWFNALQIMAEFSRLLHQNPAPYQKAADQVQTSFARFWNQSVGYCYDVLDIDAGTNDDTLRPNQLFAISLPHSPLPAHQQKAVVDSCARYLLTSHGLRSLTPTHPDYKGHYQGDYQKRDAAYHQGTVWGWLIGPFVSAHYRVYQNRQQALAFLQPLRHHLQDSGLGSISEIFDGDPPFTPRGCPFQAWSVAEFLRVCTLSQPIDWAK